MKENVCLPLQQMPLKRVLKTCYFFQVWQHVSVTEAGIDMELDFPNKSYSSAKEAKQGEY